MEDIRVRSKEIEKINTGSHYKISNGVDSINISDVTIGALCRYAGESGVQITLHLNDSGEQEIEITPWNRR